MRLILCQIGDAGLKEEAGELGLQGLLGQKGEPGMMGTDGPPGPTGEAGLIGGPGPEGGLGGNEDKGAKIQPGPSGDQGPQGDDGDQGAQGECADLGCAWGGGGGALVGYSAPWSRSYTFHGQIALLSPTYLNQNFSSLLITVNALFFYNLNRSQNQKVSLTSKQFICYPF